MKLISSTIADIEDDLFTSLGEGDEMYVEEEEIYWSIDQITFSMFYELYFR